MQPALVSEVVAVKFKKDDKAWELGLKGRRNFFYLFKVLGMVSNKCRTFLLSP